MPSLQALCIGVLPMEHACADMHMHTTPSCDYAGSKLLRRFAECLEDVLSELLEVGESVLPFLPPHCKAALLARAKQQVGHLVLAGHGSGTS